MEPKLAGSYELIDPAMNTTRPGAWGKILFVFDGNRLTIAVRMKLDDTTRCEVESGTNVRWLSDTAFELLGPIKANGRMFVGKPAVEKARCSVGMEAGVVGFQRATPEIIDLDGPSGKARLMKVALDPEWWRSE
jgi:hypothetical protein